MAKLRRLDIRIDFKIHRVKGADQEKRSKAVRDIERYAARRLTEFAEIEIVQVTSERVDHEADNYNHPQPARRRTDV